MKKKALVMIMLSISTIMLFGCGKKDDKVKDVPQSTTEATTSEQETTESTEAVTTTEDLLNVDQGTSEVTSDETQPDVDYSVYTNTFGEEGIFTFRSGFNYTGSLDKSREGEGLIQGNFNSDKGTSVGVMIYDLASETSEYKGVTKDEVIDTVFSAIEGATFQEEQQVHLSDNIDARVLIGTYNDNKNILVTLAGYGDNPDENGNPTRVKIVVSQIVLSEENANEYEIVWGTMQ